MGEHKQFFGGGSLRRAVADTMNKVIGAFAPGIEIGEIREESIRGASEAIELLRRHEKIIETLHEVALLFLSKKEDKDTMAAGAKIIADAADLDSFAVFRNFNMRDGLYAEQMYRWDRDAVSAPRSESRLKDFSYSRLLPYWEELLSGGETINGAVSSMPRREADLLLGFGVVSCFAAPVFIENSFWGFVLFEDCRGERRFDDDQAEIMRSAAFLYANAVERSEIERKAVEADGFNRALLASSPFGMMLFDESLFIFDCNDRICDMFKTDRNHFIECFYEFSPEYQPDGQKSSASIETLMRRALEGEETSFEWLHFDSDGTPLPCKITLWRVIRAGKHVGVFFVHKCKGVNLL